MSDATLFESSLKALRLRMGRAIAVPSCAAWSIERSPVPTVVARLSASEFDRNLQEDRAAVPFFALCLAWWFEHFALFGAEAVKARVELDAALPETAHGHRAAFVLHELSRLVPARFTLSPALDVRWPERPVLNEGKADRDESARPERGGEHAIEVAFTRQKDLPAQFAAIDAIEAVRRQLPVGVFDGEVRRATRWSPSGKSQIDLWAPSTDGSTIHLFELKDRGNNGLGIFPESFWYTRLVHAIRCNSFVGRPIVGGGKAMDAVRAASRVSMWLLVRDHHPLVLADGASPLSELNAAMRDECVSIGVLPYAMVEGRVVLESSSVWR